MIAFVMSPPGISGCYPVVSDPFDARPQPAAAVQGIFVHFSHPARLFIHEMIIPQDSLPSLRRDHQVAIVTVLHQVELVITHRFYVCLQEEIVLLYICAVSLQTAA